MQLVRPGEPPPTEAESQAELARLLREETTDPRIGLVTLTQVDVSPDLSNARVYWSVMKSKDSDDHAASEAGLTVALVEQPYRVAGRRAPAPAHQLDAAWLSVIEQLALERPLIVGGRSAVLRGPV